MRQVIPHGRPLGHWLLLRAIFLTALVASVAHATPPVEMIVPVPPADPAAPPCCPNELKDEFTRERIIREGLDRGTRPWPMTALAGGGPDLQLGGENEPSVALNPIDPLNVAVASAFQLRVSIDGGATFGPVVIPIVPAAHVPCGDPVVVFDRLGRLFWAYIGCIPLEQPYSPFQGHDLFVAQCDPTTGEVLAGYPANVTVQAGFPGASGNFNDKGWLAVDGSASSPFRDRLYLAWSRLIGNNEFTTLTYSTDQGATWSSGLWLGGPLTTFIWPVHVTSAPNGDVYVAEHRQDGFVGNNPDGVSGHIRVFRSTDGGATFPQQSLAYIAGQADLTFNIHPGSGEIPGAQFLLLGSAQPWILADPQVPGRIHVVACDDPDNNVNAGDPSNIYITTSTNDGQTWDSPRRIDGGPGQTLQVIPAPAIDPVTGTIMVHYYDNRSGQVNGDGNYLLDVFTTTSTDGGQTFGADSQINDLPLDPDSGAPCYSQCGVSLLDVWVNNSSSAIAVGATPAVLRFDGNAWRTEFVPSAQPFNTVWGSSGNNVFIAGRSGAIFRYNGVSWTSQVSGTTQNLYALDGRSATDVLAVGANGTIRHYNGATWSSMTSPTTEHLFGVWMSPSGKAYAGGANGTLLRFEGSWSVVPLGTAEVIGDLWGTADDNVYAVGSNGSVFHYNGSAWTSTPSGFAYLSGVWGSSETDVYAVGWHISHFDGTVWTRSNLTAKLLAKVDGSSSTNVVVVGSSGMIGSYDGATWTREPNPFKPTIPTNRIGEYNGMAIGSGRQYAVWCGNTFDQAMNPVDQQTIFDAFGGTVGAPGASPDLAASALDPSRPNPFGRSTVFAYSLPREGKVRLSLHDVMGRTVATLADGWQTPGQHSVSWSGRDGSGDPVAAGAYFLRLETAGEVNTRKVVYAR